jgi:hypothetical protein
MSPRHLLFSLWALSAGSAFAVGPSLGATHVVGAPGAGAIGRALALAVAGDTVVVPAGRYEEAIRVDRSGTSAAPIVVRALPGAVLASPQPGASLSAFDLQEGVAHVVIEGFEIEGGYGEAVFVRAGAHDVTLSGLHVHDNRGGIWIGGAANVTVGGCLIERHSSSGIRVFAGARDVEIRDTRIVASDDGRGCAGDADGISADDSSAGVHIENVTAEGNSEDGFDLQGGPAVVRGAVLRDNGCTGIKLGGGGTVENVVIERSRVGMSAGADASLSHGTLIDNRLGLRLIEPGTTVAVRNAVVSGPGKALLYGEAVRLVEDHNILHRADAKERLIERGGGERRTYSGHDVNDGVWSAETGQGEGTRAVSPRFADDGCRLSAASPAVDAGVPLRGSATDLDGAPRATGIAPDLGAFEWRALAPRLGVERLALRARRDGSGSLRVRAALAWEGDADVDPRARPALVSIRGSLAPIVEARPAAGDWRVVETSRGALFTATVGAGRERLRIRVRQRSARIDVDVRARGAHAWALRDGEASLRVEIGDVHAIGSASVQSRHHQRATIAAGG